MKMTFRAALALVVSVPLMSAAAWANTYVPVALPAADLSANINGWTSGADYVPIFQAGSVTTSSGVPFSLVTNAANGNNVVHNPATPYDLSVGVYGVTQVYTLINTAFGSYGTTVGSLTFSFASGGSYSVDLIEGVNVRDHYYGGFNNVATGPGVSLAALGSADPGRAHLDMQTFSVPATYLNDTLTQVTFTSTHAGVGGEPFLAGLTVAAVPEPESWALVLAGLGTLGFVTRRARA